MLLTRAQSEPQVDRHSTDIVLLHAVAQGSRPALYLVYDRYAAHVLALARTILGAGYEADELTTEIFIELWQNAHRLLRRRRALRMWLLLRVRRLALRGVERAPELQDIGTTASFLPERWQPRPASSAAYTDDSRFGAMRAEMCLALGFLPSRSRRALELTYFAGMSLTQVALCCGQPEEGAASRLARARSQVSQHLAEAGATR